MNVTMFLFYIVRCILELAKELIVIKYIIGYRTRIQLKNMLLSGGVGFIVLFLCFFLLPGTLRPLGYVPIVIICICILLGKCNFPLVLLAIISYVCICEIDFFITAIFNLLCLDFSNSILTNTIGLILIGVIARVCNKLDVSFYRKSLGKQRKFILVEISVLFVNIGMIGIMFGILAEHDGKNMKLLLLVAMLMSLMISVITMIFYCVMTSNQEYRQINELNTRYLDAQKNHFERMKKNEADTRKFRHDINNHIVVLQRLIKEEKYDIASSYLCEISQNVKMLNSEIRTGNDIVDAIVHEKYDRAQEYNIKFEVNGHFLAKLIISDYDICTILGNALDNAIEACQEVNGNRYIKMEIKSHFSMLHIVIRNSIGGEVSFITSKEDKNMHGYGLRNLKECVEENFGQLKIYAEKKEFVIDVLIVGY